MDLPEENRRELKEIELIEINIVDNPLDNAAQISALKSAINDAESL